MDVWDRSVQPIMAAPPAGPPSLTQKTFEYTLKIAKMIGLAAPLNAAGLLAPEVSLMRNGFVLSAVIAAAVLVAGALPCAGQAYKAPRTPDGKPNLNGIWQAMNTADWDLQAHAAGPGLVVAWGAAGAEPGGLGVVEGDSIPYLPEAAAKKKENFANRLTADP